MSAYDPPSDWRSDQAKADEIAEQVWRAMHGKVINDTGGNVYFGRLAEHLAKCNTLKRRDSDEPLVSADTAMYLAEWFER